MTFGIIILTYNQPSILESILSSFVKQTVVPDKILVLDNGSTQDYSGIIVKYTALLPLLYEKSEKSSTSYARNLACEIMDTDIISFLDGDCIPSLKYAENIRKIFSTEKSHKNLYLGDRINIDRFNESLINEFEDIKHENIIPYYWQRAETFSWTMFRDFFQSLGGFDENYVGWGFEDADLAYRLFKMGGSVFKTDMMSVWHVDHPTALLNFEYENRIRENMKYFYKKYQTDECFDVIVNFAKIWGGIQAMDGGGLDAIKFTIPR